MRHLYIDIETYSSEPIQSAGLYRYAEADEFDILLIAYSIDGGPVALVDLTSLVEVRNNLLDSIDHVVDTDVEFSPKDGFANHMEREEYEAYLRDISLLSIGAYESIEEKCKIEIIDFEEDADFYLEYKDDKFKLKKIPITIVVKKKFKK